MGHAIGLSEAATDGLSFLRRRSTKRLTEWPVFSPEGTNDGSQAIYAWEVAIRIDPVGYGLIRPRLIGRPDRSTPYRNTKPSVPLQGRFPFCTIPGQ